MKHNIAIITSIAAVALAVPLTAISINKVDEGERGLIVRLGKATEVIPPGINFKIPFIDSMVRYDVRANTFEGGNYKVASKETLLFNADVSFVWQLDDEGIINFYSEYGTIAKFNYILKPIAAQLIKETTGEYSSVDIIPKREELAATLLSKLQVTGERYNIKVLDAVFNDLTPPLEYRQAILDKQNAQQELLKQKLVLQKQLLKSKELVQTAQAQAEAILVAAQAQAEANTLVAESLTPLLVKNNEVEQWDGKLPHTVLGESTQLLLRH